MASNVDKILQYVLTPVSWIYGAVMAVRNKLFDAGIIKQEVFDIPVVSVGNITIGGTGKTPHVEYIVNRLSADMNVAVLSRGYKRKTKGFILANSKSTPETIGDEPYQIYQKFGVRTKVAVCERRREGIRRLLELDPTIQLVVLDDAFQHRFVKPKVSVLLMDYNHPIYHDNLLPLGRLRESKHGINRADMVIVTKCPETLLPINYRIVSNELNLFAYQKLYFSRYSYGECTPVFADDAPYDADISRFTERDAVLLLTGVANPRGIVRHVNQYPFHLRVMHYPDHHNFSRKDLVAINKAFAEMKGEHKLILTTEKDAVRLSNNPYFPQELKPFVYFLPINVRMLTTFSNDDFIADLRRLINARSMEKN